MPEIDQAVQLGARPWRALRLSLVLFALLSMAPAAIAHQEAAPQTGESASAAAPVGSADAEIPDRAALDEQFASLIVKVNETTGARTVTVDDLQSDFEAGRELLILDIREPGEYAVSSLPQARLVPPEEVAQITLEVPEGAKVVTYCTAGYRSGLAAVDLEKRLGIPVYTLSGGIIEWFNAGYEVLDTEGEPVDEIDAWGEPWTSFVHPRRQPVADQAD